MTAYIPPKWQKPSPLGYANAIDSVGGVASPLLAGFSLATTVLISDDAKDFRWPGVAMVIFVIAAVLLIEAVQCSFNARKYIWSAGDVTAWWPDMQIGTNREENLQEEQRIAYSKWQTWSAWTRWAYNLGIVALLAALGSALPPQHATDAQGTLRWVAAGIAFAACIGELVWFGISRLRS